MGLRRSVLWNPPTRRRSRLWLPFQFLEGRTLLHPANSDLFPPVLRKLSIDANRYSSSWGGAFSTPVQSRRPRAPSSWPTTQFSDAPSRRSAKAFPLFENTESKQKFSICLLYTS